MMTFAAIGQTFDPPMEVHAVYQTYCRALRKLRGKPQTIARLKSLAGEIEAMRIQKNPEREI